MSFELVELVISKPSTVYRHAVVEGILYGLGLALLSVESPDTEGGGGQGTLTCGWRLRPVTHPGRQRQKTHNLIWGPS